MHVIRLKYPKHMNILFAGGQELLGRLSHLQEIEEALVRISLAKFHC